MEQTLLVSHRMSLVIGNVLLNKMNAGTSHPYQRTVKTASLQFKANRIFLEVTRRILVKYLLNCFDIPEFRSTFHDMASLTSAYIGEGIRPTNSEESAISGNGSHTMDMDQGTRNSIGHSIGSLLRHLRDVMTKNLELWISSCNEDKHTVPEQTQVENVGVQEHSHFQGENESNELRRDTISDHQTLLLQQSEQSSENIGEGIRTPVQETPRPVCGHYQRRMPREFSLLW